MYIKMLEDTLKELSGEKEEEKDVEIKLNINAYLNADIIKEDRLRLELYRRLSLAKSLEEVYEIEKEIVDRFGKIDKTTQNFIEKIKIKILAAKKNIKSISNYNENISIIYNDGKKEFFKALSRQDEDILKVIIEKLQK
jgi:transcription-repair coupling factor (superfamily II helicase)